MNVSLTPELERFIQDRIDAGVYQSASEVVREALRLLYEQEQDKELKREQLRAELDVGLSELDAGHGRVVDDGWAADVKARGRARRRQASE